MRVSNLSILVFFDSMFVIVQPFSLNFVLCQLQDSKSEIAEYARLSYPLKTIAFFVVKLVAQLLASIYI